MLGNRPANVIEPNDTGSGTHTLPERFWTGKANPPSRIARDAKRARHLANALRRAEENRARASRR